MMYPSNSYYASDNNNNPNLIPSYTLDQTLPHKPSIYEINPNSKQEDPLLSSLYYNIPSPYSHYENDDAFIQHMCDLYLQQQSEITEVNAPDLITTEMAEHSINTKEILGECNSIQNQSAVIKVIPKKRTSKKDRHSKIETAQGPRDRRMRLSLQVARDFFDLQDTLGYNKASKTVEWLLSKAKDSIKDLTSCSANSTSSTSECEVVSQETVKHLVSPSKETKSTRVSTRKSAINTLTKESREKARERARERTREKRKRDGSKCGLETTMIHQMKPLGFWSQDNDNDSQLERLADVGELSISMMFNYDMHNNGVPQEHQFTDFNPCGKQWDAFNNTNPR